MSKPDELRNSAAKLRFVGRLQEQITSQVAMARAGRPPEPANDLAELLIVMVALDEETLAGRKTVTQTGVARQEQALLGQRESHQPGIVAPPVVRVVS